MKHSYRRFAAFALLVASVSPLRSQQMPVVSADLTYGWGNHSTQAGATYYRSEVNNQPRAAVSARVWHAGPLGAVVTLEYVGQWLAGDYTADCPLAPNGTCQRYFPRLFGRGFTAGVRANLSRLTIGTAFGRVGGTQWSALDSDLELALGRHLGGIVATRNAWRSGPEGQRIRFHPINAGVRLKL